MIDEYFRSVMALAPSYTQSHSPAMADRDAALQAAREDLKRAIQGIAPDLAQTLKVKQGGRQAYYSSVPWIRIFSPAHSPSAQKGYYLVYLLAADGSRVYLSLQQGTSEFRAGKMRPIRDPALLRRRAADGRQVIEDHADAPTGQRVCVGVDLAADAIADVVGPESRRRIHNYEYVSSWAWEYEPSDLVTDALVLEDLATALPILAATYRLPIRSERASDRTSEGTTVPGEGARPRDGQGLESDPDVRRAIELHAESLAAEDLSSLGWSVERVGHLHLGYDLQCRKGEQDLHVEVKGTRSSGEEVKLTGNEVRHLGTDCTAKHALFVASEVEVGPGPDYPCSNARRSWHLPWGVTHDDLMVTEYRYRVPADGREHP